MIADGLTTNLATRELPFRSLHGHRYRLRMTAAHDGRFVVTVLVRDDVPRARWTQRYISVADSRDAAARAYASISKRLEDRECLPCGSPLLNEEIYEHRGICCHSCAEARERNGGRWPR